MFLSCITPGVVFSSFFKRAKVSTKREWNARHYCYFPLGNIFFLRLPRPCLAYLALLARFALAFACLKKEKKKKHPLCRLNFCPFTTNSYTGVWTASRRLENKIVFPFQTKGRSQKTSNNVLSAELAYTLE